MAVDGTGSGGLVRAGEYTTSRLSTHAALLAAEVQLTQVDPGSGRVGQPMDRGLGEVQFLEFRPVRGHLRDVVWRCRNSC